MGDGVLRDEDEPVGGDQLVDPVIDFRVDVIRPSGYDDDLFVFGTGIVEGLFTLGDNVLFIGVVRRVGRLNRFFCFFFRDVEIL